MECTKLHIRLTTIQDIKEFVEILNKSDIVIKYSLESLNENHRVNARSLLGVFYFTIEHNNDIYLVNDTNNEFPSAIDKFRV